jgi:parvulin-like peptidyl-prolyl isomerase
MLRFALFAVFLLVIGCESTPAPSGSYVARVGSAVLTEDDLEAALAAAPASVDSMTARQQVIEQWVTAELMAREAEDRGLAERPDVQRQLAENERAVLAAALLSTLYEEDLAALNRAELEDYFERHQERLRLREPYVRVRFIVTTSEDSASAARGAMQQAMLSTGQDSLWEAAARTYATDPAASLSLAREYVPESRLLSSDAASAWQMLPQLSPGQIGAVQQIGDTYYVIQLVDRVPAGELPELAWIEDEVRRQVEIQSRKQMLARHVQRLRNEAQARDELDIRETAAPQAAPPPTSPDSADSLAVDSAPSTE